MSQLQVKVETLSPVVRRLDIEVPAERVVQVTEDVYRRLGRQVKLRGYRQGHVPRRVLERHFAEQVRTDVAREIVDRTFEEALGTTPIAPVAPPTVEPEELRPGETFRYSARVEVRPEVAVPQYKGLEAAYEAAEASDAQVDAELERLRERAAVMVPVEGRDLVEAGDTASVAYEMAFPGTGRAPVKRDDAIIRVEPGLFVDGKGGKLAGAKVGETREFSETFEGEDYAPELRGKAAEVKVTVKGLKRRELPALDDEFAKDHDGSESLAALRAKLKAGLEKEAAEENRRSRRKVLLEKLVELNPVEVPPSLVESQAQRMAEEFVENLARYGLPADAKGAMAEQFKAESRPRALFEVKSYFLLDAVAKAEGIEPGRADAEARMKQIAEEHGVGLEVVQNAYRKASSLSALLATLRQDRAYEAVEAAARLEARPKAAAQP